MDSTLALALKISGIGIVVLLLVLSLFAFVVSLMTRFMVDKPEEDEVEETTQIANPDNDEKKPDLQLIAAISLALYRDQTESQTAIPTSIAENNNSWRQFQLHRRLTQSSTIRRTR